MEKEVVPYEQALALKLLGFNNPIHDKISFAYYDKYYQLQLGNYHDYWFKKMCKNVDKGKDPNYKLDNTCIAPFYQQAFKWFRCKYGFDFAVLEKYKDLGKFYGGYIKINRDEIPKSYGSNFKTYEEAELACLKELINCANNFI